MKPGLYRANRDGEFLDCATGLGHNEFAVGTYFVIYDDSPTTNLGMSTYVGVRVGPRTKFINDTALDLVAKKTTDPWDEIRFTDKSLISQRVQWGDLNREDTIKHLGGTAPWKKMYWYHGTCVDSARCICGEGLDPARTGTGYYGKGVYLASTEAAARCYGQIVFKVTVETEKLLWVDGDPRLHDAVMYTKDALFGKWTLLGQADPFGEAIKIANKCGYDGLFITDSQERMLVVLVNKGKIKITKIKEIANKVDLPNKDRTSGKPFDTQKAVSTNPFENFANTTTTTNPFDNFVDITSTTATNPTENVGTITTSSNRPSGQQNSSNPFDGF